MNKTEIEKALAEIRLKRIIAEIRKEYSKEKMGGKK